MARLIGPDEASRTVFLTSGPNKGKATAQGMSVPLYADLALTVPADVVSTTDQAIAGTPPTLTVDAYSQIPLFKYPDGGDVVYTSINGGPPVPLYARTDERIDAVSAVAAAAETPIGAQAKADAAQAAAITAASATSKTYVDGLPERVPFGAVRVDPDQVSATHAAAPLATPTSDGSGQAVHPGMYYNPAGWGSDANGKSYRYWMAMTPYPGGLEAVENPEVIASDDGIAWVVPAGLTNPIDAPTSGFYPDVDLIDVDGVLWCIYAVNKAKSSTNGITWSPRQTLVGADGSVSPTIQRIKGEFWLWTVFKTSDGSPYLLRLQKSSTILGPYSPVQNCTFTAPAGKDLWHVCVRKVGDQFFAVAAVCDKGTSGTNTELYFATSDDGVVWRVSTKALLSPVAGTWTSQQIYHSSIVPYDGRDGRLFGLWYSGTQTPNIWRIGYTDIVAARAVTGAAQTQQLNTLVAGQTVLGGARNRLTNPSLLLGAAGNLVPLGYSNNLAGFINHAWEESTEAFTASKTGSPGGNIQIVHTDTFVQGDSWTFSVEEKETDLSVGTMTISIQWLDASDVAIGSTTALTGCKSLNFRRFHVTSTVPALAVKARLTMTLAFLTNNPCQFWLRRAQFEKGTAPITYSPSQAVVERALIGQVGNLHEWQTALAVGSGGGARVGMAVTKDARMKSGSTNEQTTVGATGAAAALPAQPLTYIRVELSDGTQGVIPVYRQA